MTAKSAVNRLPYCQVSSIFKLRKTVAHCSIVILMIISSHHIAVAEYKAFCPAVHITVSSRKESIGKLELNWDAQCQELPDTIGLFDVDPTLIRTASPLEIEQIGDHPWGFYRTNISLGHLHLPGGWHKQLGDSDEHAIPGPHCLPFWIASFVKDEIQEVTCLKIQPTWMSDQRERMRNIPISQLLIPGTHDSGSFPSMNAATKEEGFQSFVLTQDHDVWTQLVFGIRYLDMRIGYYSSPENKPNTSEEVKPSDEYFEDRFWVNHDLFKIAPLLPVLRDIKKFVEVAKDEIVIVDVHRLPVGFYLLNGAIRHKRHESLVNFIFKELGDLAIDFKQIMTPDSRLNLHLLSGPRMKDLWESGKRLIICYPEESISRGASWLWPPLKQMWGDKQTPSDLKNYIYHVINRPHPLASMQRNPLWAIMAQLTPSALDIFFNPGNNLRKMADSVNRNLTRWVKNEWGGKTNIIATDFFMGNNLIDLSVNSVLQQIVLIDDES